MASPEDRLSEIRRSEASLMSRSLTSIDNLGDGEDVPDGRPRFNSNRISRPEWEFAHEKTSTLIKELKKSPEFNRKIIDIIQKLLNFTNCSIYYKLTLTEGHICIYSNNCNLIIIYVG